MEELPFFQCLLVKPLLASPGRSISTLCAWRDRRFVRGSLWHVFRSSISRCAHPIIPADPSLVSAKVLVWAQSIILECGTHQ